jgi:hypothetical protein
VTEHIDLHTESPDDAANILQLILANLGELARDLRLDRDEHPLMTTVLTNELRERREAEAAIGGAP